MSHCEYGVTWSDAELEIIGVQHGFGAVYWAFGRRREAGEIVRLNSLSRHLGSEAISEGGRDRYVFRVIRPVERAEAAAMLAAARAARPGAQWAGFPLAGGYWHEVLTD